MTSSISAHGTLLKIGDGGGGGEVFTTIAEVRDISGPSLSANTADVTNHDSTAGWQEMITTILRGGQVSFAINYIPTEATHDATSGVINDMENRTLRNFQLVFADSGSTTWSFAALITGFTPSSPVDGEQSAAITLQISGQPTLA